MYKNFSNNRKYQSVNNTEKEIKAHILSNHGNNMYYNEADVNSYIKDLTQELLREPNLTKFKKDQLQKLTDRISQPNSIMGKMRKELDTSLHLRKKDGRNNTALQSFDKPLYSSILRENMSICSDETKSVFADSKMGSALRVRD